MIDIKIVRENPELVKESNRKRNANVDLDSILTLDQERRDLLKKVEDKKQERNTTSKKIGQGQLSPEEKQEAIQATRIIGDQIKELDQKINSIENDLDQKLLEIPNILHEDTPEGKSEDDNPEVKKWGSAPSFSFEPKHHEDLAKSLNIFDPERGVKITKSRFSLLKGAGARLERALINFMVDTQSQENGYEEVLTPFLVNSESMTGTGQLPKFEEDLFKTTDGLYLVPTGEVPVTNIYRDEILNEEDLPLNFVAFTPCFRSEAGSYGKDTKGYIRQHQFNKVELVKFVKPESSMEELERLLSHAESILQKLELPYRVVQLCSGDIGFGAAKCYDIEVWLPSENRYREISSCSNFLDFQARRAKIRYKSKQGGKPQFVHTLNGSGLAVGRTLLAIIENYQQEDGSVILPDVIRPYMNGLDKIALYEKS